MPLSTTMKKASVTAKMTFCRKPMPKAKMKTGRKIDFGIESNRCSAGANMRYAPRFSPRKNPTASPSGPTTANATAISDSVMARSPRKRSSCSSPARTRSTSDNGGNRRGSTRPERLAVSHSAPSSATKTRGAILVSHPVTSAPTAQSACCGRQERVGIDVLRFHLAQVVEPPDLGRDVDGIRNPFRLDHAVLRQRHHHLLVGQDIHLVVLLLGEVLEVLERPVPIVAQVPDRLVERRERAAHRLRPLVHHLLRGDDHVGQRRLHLLADVH